MMNDPVTVRVVSVVAEAAGCDPLALPSLHDTVDADALDALFVRGVDGPRRNGCGLDVRFSYAGRNVRVRADGTVTVGPMSSDRASEARPPE